MQSIGFIAPLLPARPRRTAPPCSRRGEARGGRLTRASRSRLGISREAMYIQSAPAGDVAVVYWEAEDVEAVFKALATSDDPYDRWFRDHVREVHGINVEDGFPPPEQVMDLRVDRISRLDSEAV